MSRKVSIPICLISALLSGRAIAATTTAPVAFVYLASSVNMDNEHVLGYAASADGELTPIPGSPFYALVDQLAVNGKYLFATSSPGSTSQNRGDIYSYLIDSDGSLTYVGAINAQTGSGNSCNVPYDLQTDQTDSDLYVYDMGVSCVPSNPENAYQSFTIDTSTGLLADLYTSGASTTITQPLVISADNKFGYAFADTGYGSFGNTPHAYQRQTNGEMVGISAATPDPGGNPSNFEGLFHAAAATDASNHLAIYQIYFLTGTGDEPSRLATYTINTDNGNLSTSSTYANMPAPLVGDQINMKFSPSGTLLAVGGGNGLQIFSFDGTSQAKALTGLITTDQIESLSWDNSNHLYALGTNGLYVFTVTATEAKEVPGSPYDVGTAISLAVQPE